MKKILTIDIGGSSVKYAIFNQSAEIQKQASFEVPATYREMKAEIIKLYNSIDDCAGIGISSPGAIDPVTGNGSGRTAIDYIPSGGNLMAELEQELNTTVAIDNDANCAAMSNVYFDNKLKSVAYIVLGSGVGGAIINDGKVVTGSTFFGGEFGYIPHNGSTFSMHAGMIGLSNKISPNNQLTGKEIFTGYDQGIDSYVKAVTEYYDAVAQLIAILKYTQNPQAIIFAGAITSRPQFIDEVSAAMQKLTDSHPDPDVMDVEIKIDKFGQDANLYGAYANLRNKLN